MSLKKMDSLLKQGYFLSSWLFWVMKMLCTFNSSRWESSQWNISNRKIWSYVSCYFFCRIRPTTSLLFFQKQTNQVVADENGLWQTETRKSRKIPENKVGEKKEAELLNLYTGTVKVGTPSNNYGIGEGFLPSMSSLIDNCRLIFYSFVSC